MRGLEDVLKFGVDVGEVIAGNGVAGVAELDAEDDVLALSEVALVEHLGHLLFFDYMKNAVIVGVE